MLPQLLTPNPGTHDPKSDSSKKPRIIPNTRSFQNRSNLPFMNRFLFELFLRAEEDNGGFGEAERTVIAAGGGKGRLVAEMAGEFAGEARVGG